MALNSGKILMRRGQEANFDPNKMMPGEWAVSLDSKYVRMCFSPGVCIRMATYEAFEADMEQIREILAECQTVEEAVQRIYEDIKDVAVDVERIEAAAASALESEENALNSANSASRSANTAAQKASDAAGSANIASTKAEQATEGANTATQKASEAAESADNVRNMSDVSQSYAVGGTGTREGEDTDNAKYYNQQASDNADRAEEAAERASAVADVGVATTEKAGLVKPDGETIRVDPNGTIHADRGTTSYTDLENKPTINDVELDGNKTLDELGIASKEALEETDNKVNIIIENAELRFKETASGEYIHLDDSADSKLVEFGLYGKAVQDGTPTPQNPVDIEVAGIGGSVEVKSKNEDGTESITSTITTENGLAGIPIDSGGNYTDQNGQQWICDEVVKYADGSGEYVQRIEKYELPKDNAYSIGLSANVNGSNYFFRKLTFIPNLGGKILNTISTHFISGNPYRVEEEVLCIIGYSNSDIRFRINDITTVDDLATWLETNTVKVLYELPVPVITPITAEQLAEIEKLSTFHPVTNISNDGGCGMKVKYIVDSKNYIDNQLAIQAKLQEEALLNMLLLMPEEVQASMIENDTNKLLSESEV